MLRVWECVILRGGLLGPKFSKRRSLFRQIILKHGWNFRLVDPNPSASHQIFFMLYCYFMYFIVIINLWMEIVLQIQVHRDFPDFDQFCSFS